MTKRIGLMVLMAAAALAPAGTARERDNQVRYNQPQQYEGRTYEYNQPQRYEGRTYEHESRYRVHYRRHDDDDYRGAYYRGWR